MKIKTTKSAGVFTITNDNAVGYDVFRNVGKYDTKTKKAQFFNGTWYKDVDGEYDTLEKAISAILPHYLKAQKAKKGESHE
jgi:hypothetical protein